MVTTSYIVDMQYLTIIAQDGKLTVDRWSLVWRILLRS